MVKFDAGFNYQPQGGHIQPRILEDFGYPFFEALEGSAVRLTETQSMQSDIHIFVGLENDGNNTFHIVVNVTGAGTPSPGMLLQYISPTYADPLQALDDAAKTVAGFLTSGWICT